MAPTTRVGIPFDSTSSMQASRDKDDSTLPQSEYEGSTREPSDRLGLLLLCVIGWASFWAWLGLFPNSLQPYKGMADSSSAAALVSFVSLGTLALSRGAFSLASQHLTRFLEKPFCGAAAATLMAIGTGVVFLACYFLEPDSTLPVTLGCFVASIAAAWLSSAWVAAFARLSDTSTFICVLLGFLMGALISLALTPVPALWGMAVVVLLPLVSGWTIFLVEKRIFDEGDCTEGQYERVAGKSSGSSVSGLYVAALMAAIFCVGLAGTVVRSLTNAASMGGAEDVIYANNWHLLGMALCALVVGVIAFSRSSRNKPVIYSSLNKAILIVLSFGMLVPGMFPQVPLYVSNLITGAAIGCFEIILMVYSASVSRNLGLSPFCTLGVAYGSMELANVAGMPLSNMLALQIASGGVQWSSIALIFLFVFVVVAILVIAPFDGRTLKFSRRLAADRVEGPFSDSEYLSDGGEASSSAEASGNAASCEEAVLAELQTRYGLTERECEVAMLLAAGRNIPFVQEALVIFKGTAQTHSRNIYRKMGIHNKQELIGLVQRLKSDIS